MFPLVMVVTLLHSSVTATLPKTMMWRLVKLSMRTRFPLESLAWIPMQYTSLLMSGQLHMASKKPSISDLLFSLETLCVYRDVFICFCFERGTGGSRTVSQITNKS